MGGAKCESIGTVIAFGSSRDRDSAVVHEAARLHA